MAANFVKITVRGNEEYSFIFEKYFTLDELGKIYLFIIMYPVLVVTTISSIPIYGYIKLASHADRFEVDEGPKGCSIIFCQIV